MIEPVAKKARIEEAELAEDASADMAVDAEAAQGPDEAVEDEKPDESPKIKEAVAFHAQDTTMNVMQSEHGSMLVPLTEGGLQYLLSGARASAGVKRGRYAFEVRVVEAMNPAPEPQAKAKTPQPFNQLRIGFSTAGSSLFVGDSTDSICFDAEGALVYNKTKTKACDKFSPADSVLTVLLNLDQSSTNACTISLFKDGRRACPPQPIPDSLLGKTLYPAVTFRNVTLHYNLGPALTPLPFKCRSLQEASAGDVELKKAPKAGQQYEVLFPVCLPEQGTFDWLDMFLEKNPQYTELSDRAVLNWCQKSGIVRAKGYESRLSNDKIDFSFGVPSLDDGSIRRTLLNIAPIQDRNFIVMEVRANLLADERAALLSRWSSSGFRKVAEVMIGEPPASFKSQVQEVVLKEKQAKADVEFKKKQEDAKRQRQLLKKQKELERAKAKNLKLQKKKAEAAKKKLEIEKKKREAAAKGEEYVEEEEPEQKEESEEEPEAPEEEEPMEADPPKAELSDEEKKLCFRRSTVPDLTSYLLNTSFTKFSAPQVGEGFDEVKYNWLNEAKAKQHLSSWISELKNTTRVEDLKPGEWFAAKQKEWQKTLQTWHNKQNAYKAMVAKKAADKAARQAKAAAAKAAKERAAALKREAEERKAEEAAAKGGGAIEDAKDEADKQPEKAEEEEPEEPEEEEKEGSGVNFEKLDVYGVNDVMDIGGGMPLFSSFGFEDWAMLGLRTELTLVAHAFKRDANDDDRLGIHLDHLSFYYQKYFKKPLNLKFYGVETVAELLQTVRETLVVAKQGKVVEPQVPDDIESFSIFVMLTEEARRDRIRRVDLGDAGAKLKVMTVQAHGIAPSSVLRPAAAAAFSPAAAAAAVGPAVTSTPIAPVRPAMVIRPAGAAWQKSW